MAVLAPLRHCLTRWTTRSGEVCLARWDEIDLVERLWTIPAERMKMAREHRGPLSGRALQILDRTRYCAVFGKIVPATVCSRNGKTVE